MNILVVMGTRPEVIKMAPVYFALKRRGINVIPVTTGQHTTLLELSLRDFGIVPTYKLENPTNSNDFGKMGSFILNRISELLNKLNPDIVLVHGDTNSAMLAAIAAFQAGINVGHVEAGLRSNSIHQPWPEEGNRRIIDSVSSYKFAPTPRAFSRLIEESQSKTGVFLTGNTVVDALNILKQHGKVESELDLLKRNIPNLDTSNYVLITQHRRESFGQPMEKVFKACLEFSRLNKIKFIFPVHPNPHVIKLAKHILGNSLEFQLIEPVNYPQMIGLIENSLFTVTDSGGIQEEAPYLNKLVVITREVTERQEAVESKNAILAGTSYNGVMNSLNLAMVQKESFLLIRTPNPFGELGASEKIAEILAATPKFKESN